MHFNVLLNHFVLMLPALGPGMPRTKVGVYIFEINCHRVQKRNLIYFFFFLTGWSEGKTRQIAGNI